MGDLKNSKRSLQKIGAIGGISGAVLIAVGSFIVPKAKDISDILEMQKAFGTHPGILQLSALFMVLGFWGLFVGVLGIQESLDEAGAAWARIGFYFNLMGTGIWTVGMSLDISYPAAIVNWLNASESSKQTAYAVVSVLSPLGFGRGLFPIEVITLWLSYLFISLGLVHSNNRPLWQGFAGLIIGIFGLILGVLMVFTGREKLLSFYIIIMLLVLMWFLAISIWTLRKLKD